MRRFARFSKVIPQQLNLELGMHVFLHTKPGVPAGSQIGSQKNYFCLAGTFQTRTLKPVPCFKFNNK